MVGATITYWTEINCNKNRTRHQEGCDPPPLQLIIDKIRKEIILLEGVLGGIDS